MKRTMKDLMIFWPVVIAFVTAVFVAGSLYYQVSQLEKKIENLDVRSQLCEKVNAAQFGYDWKENVQKIKNIHQIQVNQKKKINNNTQVIAKTNRKQKAIFTWAAQEDLIIKESTLDKFRAIAIYANSQLLQINQVRINKQHAKGGYYKIGDRIVIESTISPAAQIEVKIVGFVNDPNSPNVLLQLSKELLPDLGLDASKGRYELIITNSINILRWKSLNELDSEQVR